MIEELQLHELEALLVEYRESQKLPPGPKTAAAVLLAPRLAEHLDRVCRYHPELRDTRVEMVGTMIRLRQAVTKAQRIHPEVTYNNAEVNKALLQVEHLAARVQRLIFGESS